MSSSSLSNAVFDVAQHCFTKFNYESGPEFEDAVISEISDIVGVASVALHSVSDGGLVASVDGSDGTMYSVRIAEPAVVTIEEHVANLEAQIADLKGELGLTNARISALLVQSVYVGPKLPNGGILPLNRSPYSPHSINILTAG